MKTLILFGILLPASIVFWIFALGCIGIVIAEWRNK